MSRITWLLTASIVVITLAAGTYYVSTRTEVTRVEHDAPPPAVSQGQPATPPPPKPDHGDFNRRFEPKPPPPNGGKF